MGRRRLNQVVEGRQLGGHHRLLLLQDGLQAGVGQGPVRGVHRGKGVCEVLSLGDLGRRSSSARRREISSSSCWRVSLAAARRVSIVRCAMLCLIPCPSTRHTHRSA